MPEKEQAKHTPGPWEVDRGWSSGGNAHIVSSADRLGIADVYEYSEEYGIPYNASLIAAAPELLEACKAEQFVAELRTAKDNPREVIRLLESVGDYESGWMTSEQTIEKYEFKAARLRDIAIAKAENLP